MHARRPRARATSSAAATGRRIASCPTACVRLLRRQKPSPCAIPMATRPWQHVLEPLERVSLARRRCSPAQSGCCACRTHKPACATPSTSVPGPMAKTAASRTSSPKSLKHRPGELARCQRATRQPCTRPGCWQASPSTRPSTCCNGRPVLELSRAASQATADLVSPASPATASNASAPDHTAETSMAYMTDATTAGIAWAVQTRRAENRI